MSGAGASDHGLSQMEWTLEPATDEERPLVVRMLELYFYDFSEFAPTDLDEQGWFGATLPDRYGREPGYHVLLLRVTGRPAGFAMIDELSPIPNGAGKQYIHEFHVLRRYRRLGLGRAMAFAIFDRFPGVWQIEQIGPNLAAQDFWRRVVSEYSGGAFREYSYAGHRFPLIVQEFDSSHGAAR